MFIKAVCVTWPKQGAQTPFWPRNILAGKSRLLSVLVITLLHKLVPTVGTTMSFVAFTPTGFHMAKHTFVGWATNISCSVLSVENQLGGMEERSDQRHNST